MQACQHQKVQDLKGNWQNFTGMRWEEYWGANHIMKKSTWADHEFIQSAAWFLQLDIVIHQDIPGNPVTTISGNIDDESEPCKGYPLHIGYLMGRHYQSLLPIQVNKSLKSICAVSINDTGSKSKVGEAKSFKRDDKRNLKCCPACKKKNLKNLLLHIKKSQECKTKIGKKKLDELELISQKIRKDKVKNYVSKHRKLNPEKTKEDNKVAQAKKKKLNPEKTKEINKVAQAKKRQLNPENRRQIERESKAKIKVLKNKQSQQKIR